MSLAAPVKPLGQSSTPALYTQVAAFVAAGGLGTQVRVDDAQLPASVAAPPQARTAPATTGAPSGALVPAAHCAVGAASVSFCDVPAPCAAKHALLLSSLEPFELVQLPSK